MAKLTLKDITSGFLATQTINDNNALIEALVETFLSRDGLAPNTMLATLDMNSNRIINTLDPVLAQDVATKSYVDAILAAGIADQGGNAGLFLTTDGSVTSWADPLPDQTGNAGSFLTTNGTIAAWAAGNFLPAVPVANRLLSNNGVTESWRLDFLLTANTLAGDNANAGALLNVAASGTVPTVVGDKTDPNSGLSSAGPDQPCITAGGIQAVCYAEASSEVLQRSQMTTGLTASAVQSQGQAPLFSSYNEVTTVNNTNDVVTLPAASIGQLVTVVNNGVNDMQIFPASGENLGEGIDTSVVLSAGGTLQLLGTASGVYAQAFNLGLFGAFTDAQFCAANANGPCMQNEASAFNNPTFVPDKTDVTSGLGGTTGIPMIIATGDPVVQFDAQASTVNYLKITSSSTGIPVSVVPDSTLSSGDADVNLFLGGFGAGGVTIDGGGSATATAAGGNIDIASGTGGVTSGDSGDLAIRSGSVVSGNTGDITLSTADALVAGKGGDLFINLGDGAGAFNGGDFNVTAGAGDANTEGGFIEFDAGIGDGTAGGGGVTIRGGLGGFTAGTGGQVFIQAGLGGTGGQGGNLDLFGGPGSNAANGGATVLQGGNAGTSSGDGGALTLQGGNVAAGTGNSGAVILRTRASGTAPGVSGTLTISTGSSVGGTAGALSITGGNSGLTAGAGAAVSLTAGDGGSEGVGGALNLTAGAGGTSFPGARGGNVVIVSGAGGDITEAGDVTLDGGVGGLVGGTGGLVIVTGGSGGTTNGAGGNVSVVGGPGGADDGTGGNVLITGGAPSGFGSPGDIILTAANAGGSDIGGIITLDAGDGAAFGGAGGAITLTSGDALAGDAIGGAFQATAGVGDGTGAGGAVILAAGVGGLTGDGGAFSITSGAGGGVAENSGAVTIASGTAGATSGISGNVTIDTGTAGGTVGDIIFNLGGVTSFEIDATGGTAGFRAVNANGAALLNEASNATNPTLIPNRATLDAGIGATGGTVSIISGGATVLNVGTASGTNVVHSVASGLILGGTSGSYGLHNVGSSATVPTLLPNFLNETAGIGAGAAGEVSIIANSVERITVDSTGIGFFAVTPVGQSAAYTRNAVIVEDRTLLASASATILNNNNVLAALIADLQAIGILG